MTGLFRPGLCGEQHVADDGGGGDLAQQHADAHVADPVGDPVVVAGQRPVQPSAQRRTQPAEDPRSGRGAQERTGGAAVRGRDSVTVQRSTSPSARP